MSKYFIFIVITVCLNAASQLLMKAGMSRVGEAELSGTRIIAMAATAVANPLILLGLTTMTISMATHLLSLSRFEVSFAFPFISAAYVIVAVWGALFFGEDMNASRITGILVIMLGTVILARS